MIDVQIDAVGTSIGTSHPMEPRAVAEVARAVVAAHAAEVRTGRVEYVAIIVRDGSPLSERIEAWARSRPMFRRVLGDTIVTDGRPTANQHQCEYDRKSAQSGLR